MGYKVLYLLVFKTCDNTHLYLTFTCKIIFYNLDYGCLKGITKILKRLTAISVFEAISIREPYQLSIVLLIKGNVGSLLDKISRHLTWVLVMFYLWFFLIYYKIEGNV